MQTASYRMIEEGQIRSSEIQLIWKSLPPTYVKHKLASKKYKKVGSESKEKLFLCI